MEVVGGIDPNKWSFAAGDIGDVPEGGLSTLFTVLLLCRFSLSVAIKNLHGEKASRGRVQFSRSSSLFVVQQMGHFPLFFNLQFSACVVVFYHG